MLLARFLAFLAIFLSIVALRLGSQTLLIAPPFAVTGYLVVFHPGTRYARPTGIVASYLVVIASSEMFEFLFGVTTLSLVLNVILVSVFITFTPWSHPPALALTIFSYLVHDSLSFVLASLAVLLIVTAADLAIRNVSVLRTMLGGSGAEVSGPSRDR